MSAEMTQTVLFLGAAVAGLVIPIKATRWGAAESPCADATRDDALEALKLMKDWGVWLAGIQTAAIAALGAFFKSTTPFPLTAKLAVVFFTASIIADTVLLAGLPSIVLRLKSKDPASGNQSSAMNDIYELTTFASEKYGKRAGGVYVVSHVYFVLGILAFAIAFSV